MKHLKNHIKQLSSSFFNDAVSIRRHLHTHPELSFVEYTTSAFIQQKLTEWKIPFKNNVVKTGIVALIEGKNPAKKTIALRADIDALPIQELNTTSYKSQNEGIMHACGHDVHTASLLGTAKILSELKNEFEGSIKLIFQPGEEKLPGGASLMINEGALENPRPSSIIAQHVFPSMETGKVGFRKGMYMASTDELYIYVHGKGGHAAMPSQYNNPIFIASEIILELNKEFQQINEIPTVLAFGKFVANGATNVIPDSVYIEGTFRTMDEVWRNEAHARIKKTANRIAKELNATCDVEIRKGYPFLVNDETLTSKAIQHAQEYLGKENVEELELRMTAEDFSYYSQVMPACFYRLGTGNKQKGITAGVHTATFDIDEKAIEIGMGLMAWLAINELTESII